MKKILSGLTAFFIAAGTAQAQTASTYPSFADLVEKLSPSVVNISTTQKPENLEGGDIISLKNLPGSDGQISPLGQEHYALGSGFLVDEEGYILTNGHVIDHASSINVILVDNSQHQAKVIGTDSKTDLALIKIDTDKKLIPARLGDSDKIRVGDWILAIGNPFGLGGSVTAGIVSAKSRDIESGPYDNYIQTDASINQGNSGGPMFNLDGDVIGINTAIFSTTGGNMGISFAIPVNNAKFVIKELKKSGTVNRGWIGVRVLPQMMENNSIANIPTGIQVSSVSENSPAAKAGIQAGDIITALNGNPAESAQIFSRLVSESAIDSTITLNIWRGGQFQTLDIKVKAMPQTSDNQTGNQTANITAAPEEIPSATIETAPSGETPASEGQNLSEILNEAVNPQSEGQQPAPQPASPENSAAQSAAEVDQTPAAPLTSSTSSTPSTPSTPTAQADAPAASQPTETANTPSTESPEKDNFDINTIAPEIAPADVTEKASYTIPGSGMMVRNITIQDINEMDIKADTMGVIVVSTLPNSEAAVKGIRPGLVITKINKRNIYNTDSAKSAIYDKTDDNLYTFTVQDGENINNVTLKMKIK